MSSAKDESNIPVRRIEVPRMKEVIRDIAFESWSLVARTFILSWNDALDDPMRDRLLPVVRRLSDVVLGPEEVDQWRWMCRDWIVRVYAPMWLELVGLRGDAENLREFSAVTSETMHRVVKAVVPICEHTEAIWLAVEASLPADTADIADGAWVMAGEISWSSGGGPIGGVVSSIEDVSWRGGSSDLNPVWMTTLNICRSVAASRSAGDRLTPVVRSLQDRAFELIERMLAVAEPGRG